VGDTGLGGDGDSDAGSAAYAQAEVRLSTESPSCGLNWATLAGIGSVESNHGRFGDRVLGASGRPDRPIAGIPLDGSPSVATIPDTDGGTVDGDPVWDRAVGPMQFIPSTWARWAADGDGDQVRDPQDIDDAALGAGRYLCASGPLTTARGWRTAVLSYNASEVYLRSVLFATNDYAERSRQA
jgi:membrane-bound lytic murein transglycosylase B